MDPISLGLSSIGLSGGGSFLSGVGGIFKGIAGSQSAGYAAEVARANAIVAEQNAQYAITVGESQAATQGLKTRGQIGAIRAKQAASGVDVNTGTTLGVQKSAAELGRLDELTILNNAQQKAAAYRAQEANFQSEAELQEMKSTSSLIEGGLNGIGSMIGGASSISDKWMRYRQMGMT